MSSRSRNTLDQFTERAIRATDAGALIPPIVYLPSRLRGHNKRLTVDMVKITTDPPSIKENHIRIAEADPLGFLIALMHGQPIPAFHITKEGSVKITYDVPTLAQRERVAGWLAHKVTLRSKASDNTPADEDDWDAMVEQRSIRERDENQSTYPKDVSSSST